MKKQKKISDIHVSGIDNTLRQMPKYNAFATGHGIHKSKKYPNRATRKKTDRAEIRKYL